MMNQLAYIRFILIIIISKTILKILFQQIFCDDNKKEDALVLMNKAVVLEHHQAEYCLNFLKLFTGIHKFEHEGIVGLSNISMRHGGKLHLSICRWDLGRRMKRLACYTQEFFLIPVFWRVEDDKFIVHLKASINDKKHCP